MKFSQDGKPLYYAWFAGMAPADDPKIVVVVMVPNVTFEGRDVGAASRRRSSGTICTSRSTQHDHQYGLMSATRRINVDLPLLVAARRCCRSTAWRSSSRPVRPTSSTVAQRAYKAQAIWMLVGVIGAFAVSRASVRFIEWMTVPLYVFTDAAARRRCSSASDRAPARRRARHGWLTIAGHRLGQPAEFAKLTVVLMLARVLAQNRVAPRSMIELWKPLVVAGIPLLLIMAQGDLGTSIVFVGIFFAMLFWAGVSWQLLRAAGEPGGQPDSRIRLADLGRVVPAAARARALVQAVPRRGTVRRRRQRDDGHRGPAALGAPEAVPAEPAARLPRSDGRSARQRLSRHSVAGRDRIGRLVRHAATSTARRSAWRSSPSSTPISSSPWSARSSDSSA